MQCITTKYSAIYIKLGNWWHILSSYFFVYIMQVYFFMFFVIRFFCRLDLVGFSPRISKNRLKKNIKSIGKATFCTFLNFAYFRSYLQTKETAWKARWRNIFGTKNAIKFVRQIFGKLPLGSNKLKVWWPYHWHLKVKGCWISRKSWWLFRNMVTLELKMLSTCLILW